MKYNLILPATYILNNLYDDSVLANTITSYKDNSAPRGGGIGQGVDILVDLLEDVSIKEYTATDKAAKNGYGADYIFDSVTITPINIKLISELYGAIIVDGWDNLFFDKQNVGEFSFEIGDISKKLTHRLETTVGTVINGLSGDNTDTRAYVGTTPKARGEEIIAALVAVSLDFRANQVPASGRTVAAGRNAYTYLLATDQLTSAANTGEAGDSQALREAIVGRVAGFDVVYSPEIDDDAFVAYHAEAFVIVSRAPGKNPSAAYSELVSVPEAPIDVRVNVIGMGPRNATGLYVGTFFTVAQAVADGTASNARARKVVFATDAEAGVASVEEAPTARKATTK